MPRVPKYYDDSRLFDTSVCAFCGINEDNELLFGKYIKSDSISIHSNCLFFASGLCQRGRRESEGIIGFLLPDIEAELLRGKKLSCAYCRKRGATVGCCISKCKKSFHLSCGLEHRSLHQFFGSFSSFCKDHCPTQPKIVATENIVCHICYEIILPKELESCLYSPCCNNGWFHKLCLQKYAMSAGLYFFKCPLCNNSNEFKEKMQIYGINIPDKDASWELEENAYRELLHRPECDASVCQCSRGRKYTSLKNSSWTLLSCSHCGSHARHKSCAQIKLSVTDWVCEECVSLEEKLYAREAGPISPKVASIEHSAFEESLIDPQTDDEPATSMLYTSSILSISSSSPMVNTENKSDVFQAQTSRYIKLVNERNEGFINVTQQDIDMIKLDKLESYEKIEVENVNDSNNNVKSETYISNTNKFKISSENKGNNSNMTLTSNAFNSLQSPSATLQHSSVKKMKRKKVEHLCSNSKQCCIKKYFIHDIGKCR